MWSVKRPLIGESRLRTVCRQSWPQAPRPNGVADARPMEAVPAEGERVRRNVRWVMVVGLSVAGCEAPRPAPWPLGTTAAQTSPTASAEPSPSPSPEPSPEASSTPQPLATPKPRWVLPPRVPLTAANFPIVRPWLGHPVVPLYGHYGPVSVTALIVEQVSDEVTKALKPAPLPTPSPSPSPTPSPTPSPSPSPPSPRSSESPDPGR